MYQITASDFCITVLHQTTASDLCIRSLHQTSASQCCIRLLHQTYVSDHCSRLLTHNLAKMIFTYCLLRQQLRSCMDVWGGDSSMLNNSDGCRGHIAGSKLRTCSWSRDLTRDIATPTCPGTHPIRRHSTIVESRLRPCVL